MLVYSLFLIVSILNYVNSSCNYVTFDLKIYNVIYEKLGTFSLSTNRCQSIKALIKAGEKPLAIEQQLTGSIQFICSLSQKSLTLIRYSDEFCSDSKVYKKQTIDISEPIYLANKLFQLSLTSMDCQSDQCYVSWSFAQDCSFAGSNYYLNMSLPPNKCETLSTNLPSSYQELIAKTVESDLIPDVVVTDLQESSIKFAICKDCSLLLYNFSDSTCNPYKNYNSYKLSQKYNGQCFNVDNYRRRLTIFDEYIIQRRKLQNANYVKNVMVSWSCSDSVISLDCTQFQEISRTQLPDFCDYTCQTLWKPLSTSAPLTNAGQKNTKIITISIIFVIGFIVIIILVYSYMKYRNMAENIKENENIKKSKHVNLGGNGIKIDSKYKPMIEDSVEKNTQVMLPHSIDALDENNQPINYDNANFVTVATYNNPNETKNDI